MEYGLLSISIMLFSIQFLLNNKYQKENGTGLVSVFLLNLTGGVVSVICLAIINGFDFSFTTFTLICAFVSAIDVLGCSLFSLKALSKVNLSVFSLFMMLGGMMLPTIVGIIFYSEPLTVAKIVCVVFVILSLCITAIGQKTSGGEIYYIGVFILNGLSGVIAKFYESASFSKVSSAGYSLWITIEMLIISIVALIILKKQFKKPSLKAVLLGASGGLLNRIGNYLILLVLAVLPISIQSPLTTGGVIIGTSLMGLFAGQKLTKKDVFSIILSSIAIISLMIIPI